MRFNVCGNVSELAVRVILILMGLFYAEHRE